MQLKLMTFDEACNFDLVHNPPAADSPKAKEAFQVEVKEICLKLKERLDVFGVEGDNYCEADYEILPHQKGLAPETRHLALTIVTKRFLKSSYLAAVVRFLKEIAPSYSICIEQIVSRKWAMVVVLTCDSARVWCDDKKQLDMLLQRLKALGYSYH